MLQLSGLPADAPTPPLSMLTAHKTNSALKDTGSVTTDNPVLNWIVHAARMSVTDVLQSIGMDVPDRERLGWLGDLRAGPAERGPRPIREPTRHTITMLTAF